MFCSFDTSALINGRRDLLPPSVFVTLWQRIETVVASGEVRCVDVVRDELDVRDDEVAGWARAQTDLFVPLEGPLQSATGDVLRAHPRLVGVGGRRSGADPFVIALAIVHGGVVVTEETASGRLEKPRIPDVCRDLGVPCVTLVQFVQVQGWTF